MTSENVKRGLPSWAKVLVGLVIVSMVSFIAFAIGCILFFNNTIKQAENPAYIAKVARTIADIQEPLPPGFQYQMAVDVAFARIVVVVHKPDNLSITLGALPARENQASAESLVKELATKGIPNVFSSFNITSEGKTKVAGEDMPYVIGTAQDKYGNKIQELVGCITGTKKTILVYGLTPGGSYNMNTTKEFLSAIRGFSVQ